MTTVLSGTCAEKNRADEAAANDRGGAGRGTKVRAGVIAVAAKAMAVVVVVMSCIVS